MATFKPSTNPASFSPWLKARRRSTFGSGEEGCRNPITGIVGCCCARAASGHAIAAPPISVMNSRRLVCRESSILSGDGGSVMTVCPSRPAQRQTPMIEQLAAMLTVRRQLSDHKVATENASRLLEDAMLQRLSRRRVARLTADIDLLDQRLVEIVTADPALAHRFRLLTSMPGVGAVLACTLIALLPELGQMSRKQVAALV